MCRKMAPIVAVVLGFWCARTAVAGQLGYWAFDEGSGATARDSSGNKNDGRLVGGPTWVDGKLGKALQFDGVDDYVEVPHNAKLIPTTGQATVSVWINAKRHTGPGGSQWQGILAKGGAPRLYNLYTEASQSIHFSTGASGAYLGSLSTGKVPLNEWVHVAVTVDGRHSFYLNGEPAGTGGQGATVPTGGTSSLTIGQTGESNFFLGLIDEVRLYDVALTPAEVKELYQGNPPSWPKARDPNPAAGTVGVATPLFQWTPGDGAVLHNVYLGTSPDLTEADRVATQWPSTMYWHVPGLESGVTYYWRVDEIGAGTAVTTGDVWSFTAMPVKAYAPAPADGAKNVRRDSKLTWSPASGVVSHDVYLGTSREEVAAGAAGTFQGNQPGTTFDPGLLDGDTTYYWRIDETEVDGGKLTGDVWSLTTLPAFAMSDPNLMGWWKLDEQAGTFVADSSGHDNHGALRGTPAWVAGYDGGALELDGVDDYVEVPDHATLTVDSEVTVMAWINARSLTAEYQGVIAKGNTVRSYSLYLQSVATLHFSVTSAGAYVGSSSSGTVAANEWAHVCAMVKAGTQQYFINGEPAGTGSSGIVLPGATDTATVRLGNTQEDGRCFNGRIDEARIYNVALTQEQLQEAMQGDPLRAKNPQPPAGAVVDVRSADALSWSAGTTAARHDVYFGSDRSAVEAAHTDSPEYQGRQTDTSFSLAGLVEFGGGDYAWRIDEVEADGVTIHKGLVWTFTVPAAYIVDDMESYDDGDHRIFDTWLDNYGDDSGSVVGNDPAPFAEQTIVHSGKQSLPMAYNNAGPQHLFSETVRTFDTLQNWTLDGVNTLSLWVQGHPVAFVNKGNEAFTIGASGHDIWDNADDFRFVYKKLNGNGSVTVQVDSLVNTNVWAKAGVMIRDSLEAASPMAYMIQSFGSGASFGWRQVSGGTCGSATQTGITAPQWVKLTRTGNAFTAQYSADGKTWTDIKDATTGATVSTTVVMGASVYVGLCVTSHNSAATTTAELSGAAVTGSVSGAWQQTWVGDDPDLTNAPANLYVVVEDSSGKVATASDPALVNAVDWTEWRIPFTDLAGVNLAKVKKLYIGVGDRSAASAGGAGKIYIDDITVMKP